MPEASPAALVVELSPPSAPARPAVLQLNGGPFEDPYAWLEDPDDPEVIAYLEAENAYREVVMAPTSALQETLYQEMLERIKQSDETVPVRIDGWAYWSRTVEGLQYPILLRRHVGGGEDAAEETLLDLNQMVRTGYIRLTAWEPSVDGRLLAYLLNETGGLERTLYVKDLETGERLADEIPDVAEFEWANDGQTLFYLRQDAALRAFELYRHRLGDDPAADPLLYREEDERFDLSLDKSKDRTFLFLHAGSSDTSEVRTLPADVPDGEWRVVEPRRTGILSYPEHLGDDFLFLTNEDALNFKLVAAPTADPTPGNRLELIPHRDDRLLQGLDVFAAALVVHGREGGLPQLFVRDHATGEIAAVPFDEATYSVEPASTPDFGSPTARFEYGSFVTPTSTYDLDLRTLERTLLKREPIGGGYDPADYVSERLWATAADGARIPISVVRRRDLPDGPRPTLLYGYGAYGYSTDPGFDPLWNANRPSLLDRGLVFAIAHIRGGQEMGRHWYLDGKLLNKRNTFTDFIACAEHLIAGGWTRPDLLAFQGGSAGGLLMGAVTTMRPDLARAVVAEVPFTNVIRTMLDPSIPLTTGEFLEWGNPVDQVYREYMESYSPIDNVAAVRYPELLLTGGFNDDQVQYWEPAKFLAKLRAVAGEGNRFLFRIVMGAGHAGASGRYDFLREVAHDDAFILQALGLNDADEEIRSLAGD